MTPQRLRSLLHGRRPSDVADILRRWSPVDAASPGSETRSGPLVALLASTTPRSNGRCLGDIWRSALDDALSRAQLCERRFDGEPAMSVHVLGDPEYPRRLALDRQAPAVLFTCGRLETLDGPRVGIVGTRHATASGRACARRIAEVLGAHGISVVSGLARGIDVSAHRGVLDQMSATAIASTSHRGGPIGVVASGLDVVYPPEHADIWRAVALSGLLVSESPPGTEPHAYRFPLRNRIIAALCDVLVVVESRVSGGSMITVREALERGVTVMAVPGTTSTRAAEGTNQLIRDGASIVVEPEDILAVLGIEAHRRVRDFDSRPQPSARDAALLDLIGDEPMTVDHIVANSGRELADVALALGRLEAKGWLLCTAGWFERLSRPEGFPGGF